MDLENGTTLKIRLDFYQILMVLGAFIATVAVLKSEMGQTQQRTTALELRMDLQEKALPAIATGLSVIRHDTERTRQDLVYLREQVDKLNRSVKELR